MYDIALSVNAFVRSQTRADVAWLLATDAAGQNSGNDAVVFTPGGGRLGNLFNGAFDSRLMEIASRKLAVGRIVDGEVTPLEATISGLPLGAKVRFAIIPADLFEDDIWQSFLEREKIAFDMTIAGDEITRVESYNSASILAADPDLADAFKVEASVTVSADSRVISIFLPIRKVAIFGNGPIPQAIAGLAQALGWQVSIESKPDNFAGVAATLSSMDSIVVTGHEVESSGRALAYALESKAGYIGALGSRKMQDDRADWLAYRDIVEISRIHGPAGFSIGAKSPLEIALSVLAQALAVLNGI
jgi:xanthine dehydrogenase accessory factor